MRILLIGGTGAMGRPLSDILISAGHEVLVTTRKNRTSNNPRLKYIVCDAHSINFLQEIESINADIIVDFMHYSTEEFANRYMTLLNTCNHYFFFSSARVYADNNGEKITESCQRLIDVNVDEALLDLDEYPISKARCENLLCEAPLTNWTVIRPYITFGHKRLQLGIFEIEAWFHRVLDKQAIVIPEEILDAKTTLTYGGDVAKSLALLIGNDNAKGKMIHITSDISFTWREIAEIYNDIFKRELGYGIKLYSDCDLNLYSKAYYSSRWQIKYDRCYDRCFDNGLIHSLTGMSVDSDDLHNHIEKVILDSINEPSGIIRNYSPVAQACMDRLTDERTKLNNYLHPLNRVAALRYFCSRYAPLPKQVILTINNALSDVKHNRMG